MASSDRTPDMSRVISDLSKAINQLVAKMDNLGGSGRPGSSTGGGRAKPKDQVDTKEAQKNFKNLSNTARDVEKEINALRRGFSNTTKTLRDLYEAQDDATRGMIKSGDLSKKAQKDLIESINNSIRHYSFMGQSMANAGKKAEFLEEKLEETGKFLGQYGEILKEIGEQSLSSITDNDKLRKALQKLNKEMVLSDEVQEMIRKNEFTRAARTLDDEARNANIIRTSIRRTSTSFGGLQRVTDGLRDGVEKATLAIRSGITHEAATLAGSMAVIVTGAKEAYKQYWETASAGFGGAFVQLSMTAINLGISLQSLTNITQANMKLVGKMGLRGFTDSLKESQQQLMQLGLTTEQAAKARAEMNQVAFLTGVDMRDKAALSKATNAQIADYEHLRAVTGESIEALAAQTKAILMDNDSTKIMSSLNKAQRVQMVQSINMERKRLVTMGLTNEAAINVIKTFQQIQNSKVADRLDASAGAMAAASAVGMDPAKAAKAASILQRGRAAMKDPENAKFMADFSRELTSKTDALAGKGDLNSQILGEYADEASQALTGMKDSMREANLDRGMTPGEVEANKAIGRVPAEIASVSAKIESVGQILQSPLTKILVGVLGIGYLLAKNFAKLGKKKDRDDDDGPDKKNKTSGTDADGDKKPGKKGNGKVGARPGSVVQDPDRFSSQMGQVAKKHGWTPKQQYQEAGLPGHQQITRQIQADKAFKERRKAGLENSTSIGSQTLQQKIEENRKKVQARIERDNALQGPPAPPRARTLADRIDDARERTGRRTQGALHRVREASSQRRQQMVDSVNGFGDRITRRAMESAPGRTVGALGRAGSATVGAVAGGARSAAGAVAGGASRAMGGIMSLGAKAVPFLGVAVAAIEGLKGAMDGVNRAAEIFGVDTKKTALTSAQKISAGIAGALNTLSFGLIPTDGTARLLNDVATDGVQIITDYAEGAVEWIVNNGIPALYDAFKSVMGWIGGAITDALSPSTWIAAFTGEGGDGGIVNTILRSLVKGVQFMGTALMKGAIKVGSDLIEGMINLIPDWAGGKSAREGFAKLKAESANGGLIGFASTDTKFSDTDTPEEAKKRKEREAKKAARDKKSKSDQHEEDRNGNSTVQGTAPTPATDNLGLVNQHGEALTRDQLAAQGVQASPASSGTPSVDNPSGAPQAAPGGASGGSGSSPTPSQPTKTAEETLLGSILTKVTELVEITDKNYKLAQEDFKLTSTRQRLGTTPQMGTDGYAPSLSTFLNMPM